MKLLEWDREIDKLTNSDKEKHINAIKTLLDWDTFEKEYGWRGLRMLRILLSAALRAQPVK